MNERDRSILTVINGEKDTLIDRLTEGLPDIFFALRHPGVSLVQKVEEITPEVVTRVAKFLPTSAPERKDEGNITDLIVFAQVHPSTVQINTLEFNSGNLFYECKPHFLIRSDIYLQRPVDEINFPSLQAFRTFSCGRSDYKFLKKDLNIGPYTLLQKVGIPAFKQPSFDQLVQHNVQLGKLASALLDSSNGSLILDHLKETNTQLKQPFQSWTRLEQETDEPGSFDFNVFSDVLSEAICKAFQITVQTSSGIAKDYLRATGRDLTKTRSLGYYGTTLPDRRYDKFMEKILDYLTI